jgi:hypothetical protein
MAFPLSIRGGLPVTGAAADPVGRQVVLTRLRVRLLSEGASQVEVGSASLSFTVRWFRLRSNWNLLAPYDRGKVLVVHEGDHFSVEYDFSTRRLFIIATIMCGVLGLMIAIGGARSYAPPLLFAGVAWVWLFGGNYLIAQVRLGRWIRQAVNR